MVLICLVEMGLKLKMFATWPKYSSSVFICIFINSSFRIEGKTIKWAISGDAIVICKVSEWWSTIQSGLAVISSRRSGEKAINVCHVIYRWQYQCYVLGIVSTSWCTILPSLSTIRLVEVQSHKYLSHDLQVTTSLSYSG